MIKVLGNKVILPHQTNYMITKGTSEYQAAQKLANDLIAIASKERWNNNTSFKLYFDPLGSFLNQIEKLNIFASQIAKTVGDNMDPYGFKIANLSSKQAWILACAAIENNITEQFINK
jgi:hypothetical protein